jgi:hypothetical protein
MFRVQTVKNQSITHQFWVSLNLSNNSYKVSDFLNPVHLIAISDQKEALLRLLLNWEVKKKKKNSNNNHATYLLKQYLIKESQSNSRS